MRNVSILDEFYEESYVNVIYRTRNFLAISLNSK